MSGQDGTLCKRKGLFFMDHHAWYVYIWSHAGWSSSSSGWLTSVALASVAWVESSLFHQRKKEEEDEPLEAARKYKDIRLRMIWFWIQLLFIFACWKNSSKVLIDHEPHSMLIHNTQVSSFWLVHRVSNCCVWCWWLQITTRNYLHFWRPKKNHALCRARTTKITHRENYNHA